MKKNQLRIDILTLFPKMFDGPLAESIVGRAQKESLVDINIHYLRDWAKGRHQVVDDRPYGGGVGMLLMIEPIYTALEDLKKLVKTKKRKIVLLEAAGNTYTQEKAQEYSQLEHLILIAARYEGVDYRIREHLVDEEISIGNYVLTGGEIPAMVIIDSITRLIPGVLKKEEATKFESYSDGENIEPPQYTRPEKFKDWSVPEVLLSGNHKIIDSWKEQQSTLLSSKRNIKKDS